MTTTARAAEDLMVHRPMLFGLAYRLLGSAHDADDVLQDAYLRWARADRDEVRQPRRYLARMVTRLALDTLRTRQARRKSYVGPWLPEPVPIEDPAAHRESLSIAMLHLLERLTPPERAVYLLRTAFDVPYGEIAETLERPAEHCRQLYRRASAAVEAGRRRFDADRRTHDRLLARFVAAARDGDLAALRELLHHDVVAWSDGGGRARAARNPVRGAGHVARFLAGIYGRGTFTVEPISVNGGPALLIIYPSARHVLTLAAAQDRISDVYLIANPDKLDGIR